MLDQADLRGAEEALRSLKDKVGSLQVDPNDVANLEVKKNSLQARQDALMHSQEAFVERLVKLPPKSIELARLEQDVRLENAVYLALMQEYESTFLSEGRARLDFSVLDPPSLPDEPTKPKRRAIVLGGLVGGLMTGGFLGLARSKKKGAGAQSGVGSVSKAAGAPGSVEVG